MKNTGYTVLFTLAVILVGIVWGVVEVTDNLSREKGGLTGYSAIEYISIGIKEHLFGLIIVGVLAYIGFTIKAEHKVLGPFLMLISLVALPTYATVTKIGGKGYDMIEKVGDNIGIIEPIENNHDHIDHIDDFMPVPGNAPVPIDCLDGACIIKATGRTHWIGKQNGVRVDRSGNPKGDCDLTKNAEQKKLLPRVSEETCIGALIYSTVDPSLPGTQFHPYKKGMVYPSGDKIWVKFYHEDKVIGWNTGLYVATYKP